MDFISKQPLNKPNQQENHSNLKERITIRIDSDILQWFRQLSPQGRGYQSRINYALREFMNNGVQSVEESLRKVMREEIQKLKTQENI